MTVSIITTAFNSAKTLADTLESILRQTYKDIECWVIDGGSTDGTLDIIRSYEPRFEGKMHWISEPDKSLYDAMNKGLDRVKGDVIGILNSDDYYTSDDVLETVINKLRKHPSVSAVYGDVHYVNADNLDRVVRYYSSASFSPWKLRFGYMPAHPAFYIRREAMMAAGHYSLDYELASDYEMMVRLFCKYKIGASYIKKDMVTMRTGGLSNNSFRSRMVLTHEDAKACRANGYYSNFFLCCTKYLTKVFEFLK